MPDDRPDRVIGNAEMGNVQVGHRGMAATLEADAAKWAEMHELSLAKAQEAKDARARGTNDTAEEVPYPQDQEARPTSPLEVTNRLMGENLINLKRQPTDWAARTVVFDTTNPVLIAGRRELRDTIVLFNASGTVNLATTAADLGTGSTQAPKYIQLTSGLVISIETEGPVVGTAAAGTTISVIETFYDARKIAHVVERIVRLIASGQIKQQVG